MVAGSGGSFQREGSSFQKEALEEILGWIEGLFHYNQCS